VQLAGGRKFLFRGTSQADWPENPPVVRRGDHLVYEFPECKKIVGRSGVYVYCNLGPVMNVCLRDDRRYCILFYDPSLGRYLLRACP